MKRLVCHKCQKGFEDDVEERLCPKCKRETTLLFGTLVHARARLLNDPYLGFGDPPALAIDKFIEEVVSAAECRERRKLHD